MYLCSKGTFSVLGSLRVVNHHFLKKIIFKSIFRLSILTGKFSTKGKLHMQTLCLSQFVRETLLCILLI